MTDEELIHSRAAVYTRLLDPEYANQERGFHHTDRNTLKSYDQMLEARGFDIGDLPEAPAYDSGYVPGSGSRATYYTSKSEQVAAATTSASKAPASSVIDDTIAPEKPKSGPLKVGTSADVRTAPSDIGTDAASSGGKVTASGATHTVADTVDLTTNNTNPSTTQPKAQAKIDSQNTAGGRTAGTQRPSGPGPTRKSKDMLDNGLRTAQDLAGGNARLMGIAAAAGLLGIGVVASRKKNNPAPDRGTYLDQSRRDLGY